MKLGESSQETRPTKLEIIHLDSRVSNCFTRLLKQFEAKGIEAIEVDKLLTKIKEGSSSVLAVLATICNSESKPSQYLLGRGLANPCHPPNYMIRSRNLLNITTQPYQDLINPFNQHIRPL